MPPEKYVKPFPDLSMNVNSRSVKDSMEDLREFARALEAIRPKCLSEGCPDRINIEQDPYYCQAHQPK